MTVRHKAYKYRIYPNAKQIELLAKTFGCVRFVYNHLLAEKIEHYERTKQTLKNTPAHLKKEYEWLREIDSMALWRSYRNGGDPEAWYNAHVRVGVEYYNSRLGGAA